MTLPCSVASEAIGLGCFGTAPRAGWWVLLEQDGPWGRVAATQSHLPPELGARLDAAISAAGGRFGLIRRPGRHADDGTPTRQVLLASGGERPVLLGGTITDPHTLAELDLTALAAGDMAALQRSSPWARPVPPALLVCTNGRRDRCCSTRGRVVALAGATAYPGRVWEASQLGGHRFAPTGVLLPWGRVLGRLTTADPGAILAAASVDVPALPTHLLGDHHDRGAASLPPAAQAALSAVAAATGNGALAGWQVREEPLSSSRSSSSSSDSTGSVDDIMVDGSADSAGAAVTRLRVTTPADGAWQVTVRRVSAGSSPDSCGADPVTQLRWELVQRERVTTPAR